MTPLVTSLVHDNMEHLLRLPTKCGEQTASKMSFSVYILTYLKRINQLTPSMEKKAAGYIQEGKCRIMSVAFIRLLSDVTRGKSSSCNDEVRSRAKSNPIVLPSSPATVSQTE